MILHTLVGIGGSIGVVPMESLRVFVCSTFADLSDERSAVLDAIRRLQLQHDSMEFFGARANQPLETCLEEVRRSNVLVVIVGHRYGTLAPNLGISFSEAEYREGQRLGKPSLVYMRDESVPILPKYMERDSAKLSLLEAWKSALQERHTVANFRESTDLALQVAADLSRTIAEMRDASRAREQAWSAQQASLLHELEPIIEHAKSKGIAERVLLSVLRRAVANLVSETQQLGPTVFFSYSRSDEDLVRKVADGLAESDVQVWLDQTRLTAGDNWVNETERALDSADFVAFFISPRSLDSPWAKRELQLAMHRELSGQRGALILPVLLEKAEVPPLLRDIHWIDMTDGDADKAVQALIQAMDRHRGVNMDDPAQPTADHGRERIPEQRILSVLEEERGLVGAAARRLGVSPKRLYQLMKYYNVQPRQYR